MIRDGVGDEEAVFLPPQILSELSVNDLPEEVNVEVGTEKDNTRYIDWDGHLFSQAGKLCGGARYLHTRKYGDAPLGLPFYLDLVRRHRDARSEPRRRTARELRR